MIARKNILFLTHRVPYPPNRGDRIRSFQMLRYLADRYQVYLGALADEPVPAESLAVLKQLTREQALVPLGASRRWLAAAASLASGRSATEGLFASRRLRSQIRAWGAAVEFHAVIAFCSSMVQFASLPELKRVPLVVDLVDVDSQKWLDYAAATRGWTRWLLRLEAARVRRLECSLASLAAGVLLTTEAEAEIYRGFCPNEKTYVVANGVDLEHFRPHPAAVSARPNQCVFVGVLDYWPNVAGLTWFATQVWPLVRARQPDAVLAIVGKNPVPLLRKLAQQPGIRLVGEVPDVRPFMAESRFSIAPLQIARGVQNKVLEAMAMGTPVLATPEALEGLQVQAGLQALAATTAHAFADAACRLYDDGHLCRRLAQAGREFAQQRHSWPECLDPLGRLLEGSCRPNVIASRRQLAALVQNVFEIEEASV